MSDPFARLGLTSDATPHEVRAARRDLAREHHPDAGGDEATMRELNVAAADALRLIAAATSSADSDGSGQQSSDSGSMPRENSEPADGPRSGDDGSWMRSQRDIPSFTVEALPVETFEALLLACAELGELVDDDPPYELRARMADPTPCWCQLDVVPDAGSSTVSVTIAPVQGSPHPSLLDVRNAWITALNGLDWSSL